MSILNMDAGCQTQPCDPAIQAAHEAEQAAEADAFLASQAESVLFADGAPPLRMPGE